MNTMDEQLRPQDDLGGVLAERRAGPTALGMQPAELVVLAGVVEHVEELAAAASATVRSASTPKAVSRCPRAASRSSARRAPRAPEPPAGAVALVGGAGSSRARRSKPRGHVDRPGLERGLHPGRARNADTRASPDPGEASRCWATVAGVVAGAQSNRAARACSSPDGHLGQLCLDRGPRISGCRNSTGSPCAQDAGGLEPRGRAAPRRVRRGLASSAAACSEQPSPEHSGRLGQAVASGPSSPSRHDTVRRRDRVPFSTRAWPSASRSISIGPQQLVQVEGVAS